MIPTVYDWALETPIGMITEFVKYSKSMPLYVIGSGGSFTSATFASLLHQMTGTISKCITPLEFLGYRHIDRNCSVLIITAKGNIAIRISFCTWHFRTINMYGAHYLWNIQKHKTKYVGN